MELTVSNIEVTYSKVILVLRGVSLQVHAGQIVSLLGANGAGKTTVLKAISGLLRREEGEIIRGSVNFGDQPIDHLPPEEVVRLGIVQVLEGRRLFQHLTVEENLLVGGEGRSQARGSSRPDLERIYHYFPRLRDLRKRTSGYLSGGEQQMLVIGRGLMAHPSLMLLDEPSLGLAPLLVDEIFDIVRQICVQENTSILLVEQNTRAALETASYAYVMENGRIVLDGPAERLRENEDIKEFYLGQTQLGQRRSYRDVKHYKRRKRWLG